MAVPGATLPPPGQGPGLLNADGTPAAAAYGGGASSAPSTAGALGPAGIQGPPGPWMQATGQGALGPVGPQGPPPVSDPAQSGHTTPTTPPPPVQQGPQFMNAAMLRYVAQFQQSQAAQQQAINSGFITAMSGLGARRDAAATVSAGLPAQYNTAYQAAQASNAKNDAALAPNLGPANSTAAAAFIKANTANNSKAGAAAHAADLGSQAMMNAGITADYSQGATALSNTKMSNQSGLDAQAANFALQQAHDQATFDQATAQADQTTKNQEALFKYENPNAALTPAQQQAATNAAAADQRAIGFGFANNAALTAVTSSPFYSTVTKALGGQNAVLPNGQHISGSPASIIAQIAGSNMDIIHALLATDVITPTELSAALGAVKGAPS